MNTIIKMNSDQLDQDFVAAIKKLFRNQEIEISIRSLDETEYLLKNDTNKNHLYESIEEYHKGKVKVFSLDEFYDKYEKMISNE